MEDNDFYEKLAELANENKSAMLPSDSYLYKDKAPEDRDRGFCFLCSFSSDNIQNSNIKKLENILIGENSRKTRKVDRINNAYIFYNRHVKPYVHDVDNLVGCGPNPEWNKSSIRDHVDCHDKSVKNILSKQWDVLTESSNLLRFNSLCNTSEGGKVVVNEKGLKQYEILLKLILQISNRLDNEEKDSYQSSKKRKI
jgi:hypothetical protein